MPVKKALLIKMIDPINPDKMQQSMFPEYIWFSASVKFQYCIPHYVSGRGPLARQFTN